MYQTLFIPQLHKLEVCVFPESQTGIKLLIHCCTLKIKDACIFSALAHAARCALSVNGLRYDFLGLEGKRLEGALSQHMRQIPVLHQLFGRACCACL